ncbi:MAG: hypothetical protein ACD_33C00045G0021 [uncultured bacterium]|nr:MAG: hypothetical protein ACD_33C00045G0021 [uncultured bacterium]
MLDITCYACGGTGINIVKKINNLKAEVVFIDTSVSNLKSLKSPNIFMIDDMDGAGKHRGTTYDNFKDVSDDVIIKFKPSDSLNIVISSLSGGSGSVIAPMITKSLLDAGKNTIVIGINSKHSVIELNNTIKTLKTYKSISDLTGKSICLAYVENTTREEADDRSTWIINLLSILANKDITEEFDTSDLSNFINFDKTTDNKANVCILNISDNVPIIPKKNTNIVSSILITSDRNNGIHPVIPEYLSTCIFTDESTKINVRLDNVLGELSSILEDLEKQIKDYQDNKKVNKFKDIAVEGNSDGVVL